MSSRSDRARQTLPVAAPPSKWTYPLLIAAALVHAYLCWRWKIPLAWDATHSYLPAARRLLTEGWSFLLQEESVRVPFGAYAYPALLNVDVPVIEGTNLVLSICIVPLIYRIGTLADSVRAGVIGAWLYATSAAAALVLNVLSEIPFLFFCALWLWAFGELCASSERRWKWIAGLALAIAVNFRASLVPFVYLSALAAIAMSMRHTPATDIWKKLASTQGVAAVILTLVIGKNLVLFGLPQVSSGAGTALYLGNHTLVGGYEPSYAGLFYDDGGVAREDHLKLRADRYLGSIAWQMLREQPLWLTLTNYWRKAWAFLFYPNVLLDDSLFTLRSLRIVLCAGALVAIVSRWRAPAIALATSALAYQVLVHIPVLYNPRYADGALDVWLPLLAGCGFATASRWPPRNASLFGAAVLAACLVGKSIRHLEDQVAPLHFNAGVPHRVIWQKEDADDLALDGLVRDHASGALRATAEHASIHFRMPALGDVFGLRGTPRQRTLFVILDVSTPPSGGRCDKGRIVFRPAPSTPTQPASYSYYPFRLARNSAVQTFSFGVSVATPTWVQPIDMPGDLAIEFSCDIGGTIRFARFAFAESTYGLTYGRDPPKESSSR